jgi:hypothetical protein
LQEDLLTQGALIQKFLDAGVEIIGADTSAPAKAGAFRFCITGSLSQPKSHFEKLICAKGHGYTDTFSKEVTHLVAADPGSGSSKLEKARKMNIPVISEQELLALLDGSEGSKQRTREANRNRVGEDCITLQLDGEGGAPSSPHSLITETMLISKRNIGKITIRPSMGWKVWFWLTGAPGLTCRMHITSLVLARRWMPFPTT